MRHLEDLYDEMCETPSDIFEHLPMLRALAEDATTIIELGVRSGVSSVAFLAGLPGEGRLWSVDLDAKPEGLVHDSRWTFLRGDDLDPKIVERLPVDADVVFIDTSHLYEHTLAELSVYRWFVKPGGVMVLHDTELPIPEGHTGAPFPVKRAVSKFCAENGLRWDNHPNCWGLAIIHIPW